MVIYDIVIIYNMSTRSMIKFQCDDESVSVYKHWDGYPEVTIKELQTFLKWNGARNDDLPYTVANFCYWYKKGHEEHTGLGVISNPDQDWGQEYMYTVHLKNNRITEKNSSGEWNF
jgi:hypothetical protein